MFFNMSYISEYSIRPLRKESPHLIGSSLDLDLRGTGIVLGPDPDKLVQMMRTQDGRVSGQVVKVVHDDCHEQVEHEERAEEDEGDKVDVGEVGAAHFGVEFARGGVEGEGGGVTGSTSLAGQHDTWPSFTRGTSVQGYQRLEV